MPDAALLWLFFSLVFGIIIVPGMDMTFVLANALAGGRRLGLYATAGVVAGGVAHVVVGALGVGALLRLFPALFNALLLAGAAYIAWIGFSLLRSGASLGAIPAARSRSGVAALRQGMLTCLLNPKAYLFMFAVFPQFLRPEAGEIWLQAAILGTIIAVTQFGVYGGLAVAAGGGRGVLAGHPRAEAAIGRAVGALLIVVAALTLLEGWRSLAG
jgi:threonine/homoserine/homoserine lactone efflux protein